MFLVKRFVGLSVLYIYSFAFNLVELGECTRIRGLLLPSTTQKMIGCRAVIQRCRMRVVPVSFVVNHVIVGPGEHNSVQASMHTPKIDGDVKRGKQSHQVGDVHLRRCRQWLL